MWHALRLHRQDSIGAVGTWHHHRQDFSLHGSTCSHSRSHTCPHVSLINPHSSPLPFHPAYRLCVRRPHNVILLRSDTRPACPGRGGQPALGPELRGVGAPHPLRPLHGVEGDLGGRGMGAGGGGRAERDEGARAFLLAPPSTQRNKSGKTMEGMRAAQAHPQPGRPRPSPSPTPPGVFVQVPWLDVQSLGIIVDGHPTNPTPAVPRPAPLGCLTVTDPLPTHTHPQHGALGQHVTRQLRVARHHTAGSSQE